MGVYCGASQDRFGFFECIPKLWEYVCYFDNRISENSSLLLYFSDYHKLRAEIQELIDQLEKKLLEKKHKDIMDAPSRKKRKSTKPTLLGLIFYKYIKFN